MLFAVLPLGVERHQDTGRGHDAGAPKAANIKKKLILNTVLSAVLLLVIYVLAELDIIKWHQWFDSGEWK